MKKIIIYFFLIVLGYFSLPKPGYSQTFTITHYIDWETTYQNMWGPNGSPFSIDMDDTLFWESFSDNISIGQIENILGGQFGAVIDLDLWLELGAVFSLHGFTTGSVDVRYPVKIDLVFPDDYTFNPGEIVTINTSYEVEPGWYLDTHFPTAGVLSLDFYFGMGVDLDATICVWDCLTLDVININFPTDSFNIIYINSVTGEVAYPCFTGGYPHICHDYLLPIIIDDWFGIGLTGWITIPYITTYDYLDPVTKCLHADGDSAFMGLDLDIIQFLSFLAQFIPPPAGPALQQILSMMSGTYNLGGGITIDYTLLSVVFGISNTLVQNFSFCPVVWTEFDFPTNVDYTVTDPDNGNSVEDSGNSDTINVHTDYDLHFQYPCYGYPIWDIGLAHSITSGFTNHTWDSIEFHFTIQAFEFWINLPFLTSIPEVQIPELCVPVSYPCPTPADPSAICTYEECSPAIIVPSLTLLATTIHIGPLIDITLPLGYIPWTWFEETWNLAGFHDTICPPTQIIPNPPMDISLSGNDILCFGASTGSIVVTVEYGTPPYTYTWSTGQIDSTYSTIDSLTGLSQGIYYVTVSDANNCTMVDSTYLADINPEIFLSFDVSDVLCHGDSTGSVFAIVSGGTPGYTYLWSPYGGTGSLATNLIAGTYTLTVTDDVGCTKVSSVTVNEPDSAIYITIDSIADVLCYGDNTGSVYISVAGGTPPFTYLWSNGATTQDISNLITGLYIVTVTDANGCINIDSAFVNQPDQFIVYLHDVNICYGQSIEITVDSITGGTPPYSECIWSNGVHGNSITVNPLSTTTYYVHAVDANGCMSEIGSVTVSVTAQLQMELFANDFSVCLGDSIVIDAYITGGGGGSAGGGPYIVHLSEGTIGPVPIIVYPDHSQIYVATVYDSCNFASVSDSISIIVLPLPPVNFYSDINSGCQPLTVNFFETNPDQGQTYSWNFGDNSGPEHSKNPTHTFIYSGIYDITLTVMATWGCDNTFTYENMITVYEKPTADFLASPRATNILEPTISFDNLSSNTFISNWLFGDGTSSEETNPEHTYNEIGQYTVMLIVETEHGCKDTAYSDVLVSDIYTLYAPNAFTPGHNGVNDIFKPVGNGIDPDNFEMIIYNRWGQQIFKTKDINEGWNGRFNGKMCPQSAYTWVVRYKDNRGMKHHKVIGTITLVR